MIYQGEFLNDKKHGLGFDYLDGTIRYKGEFKYDQPSGFGSTAYPENSFYLGEWKNGLYNGYVNLYCQFIFKYV